MIAPSVSTKNVMQFLILPFFIVGCGGGVKDSTIAQSASIISTPSNTPISAETYYEILDSLGLKAVFTYGKVRLSPELITIPLTPKDINIDPKNTGKITRESQLLKSLGNSIAHAINKQTGFAKNKIEVVIYEVKCEARILNEEVVEDCDRKFPFSYSTAKNESLRELRSLDQVNYSKLTEEYNLTQSETRIEKHMHQRRGELRAKRQLKNKIIIQEFCKKYLHDEFDKNYSPYFLNCHLITAQKNGKNYFSIKNINTKNLITDEYSEKFDINFEVSIAGFINLSISGLKYSSVNKFDVYKDLSSLERIKNRGRIVKAESLISEWLDEFMKKQEVDQ